MPIGPAISNAIADEMTVPNTNGRTPYLPSPGSHVLLAIEESGTVEIAGHAETKSTTNKLATTSSTIHAAAWTATPKTRSPTGDEARCMRGRAAAIVVDAMSTLCCDTTLSKEGEGGAGTQVCRLVPHRLFQNPACEPVRCRFANGATGWPRAPCARHSGRSSG